MTSVAFRDATTGTRPAWSHALRRQVRRVAEAAVTPLEVDDVLDVFHPLRRGAPLRGRIVAVRPETADAATLEIKPGASWAGHVPGQYVRIGIDVDGVRHWRAYSLTHGPRPDGLISITVKAVPDGHVSDYLVHRATPGTTLHLEQAAGEFVLPEPADDAVATKLLFVTAGSGITPVIGMLRNLYPSTDTGVLRPARSAGLDIVVVHVAPSEPSSIFRADLQALDTAGAIRLVARYDDQHGVLDVADLDDPRAGPRGAPYVRVRPRRAARRARGPPRRGRHRPVHRAVPHRSGRGRRRRQRRVRPERHRRSRSTAPPRSWTRPRRPAS